MLLGAVGSPMVVPTQIPNSGIHGLEVAHSDVRNPKSPELKKLIGGNSTETARPQVTPKGDTHMFFYVSVVLITKVGNCADVITDFSANFRN